MFKVYNYITQLVDSVDQGPVVQRIVSLTTSLIRQLVMYIMTTLSNTLLGARRPGG